MEFLLGNSGQRVRVHVYSKYKSLHYISGLIDNLKGCCVFTCLNVKRYLNGTPHRACLHCRNSMWFVLVYDIGHKPLRQCHGVVATRYIVIGNHIVDKTCIATVDAGRPATFLPFCHAHRKQTLVALAVEHSLDVCTLTLPCMEGCLVLLCNLWYLVQFVVNITRSPSSVQAIGQYIPCSRIGGSTHARLGIIVNGIDILLILGCDTRNLECDIDDSTTVADEIGIRTCRVYAVPLDCIAHAVG